MWHFIINSRAVGLNEYINAERSNRYKAAKSKREGQDFIRAEIKRQLLGLHIESPVFIVFHWYEKDMMRDKDNIAFAKKFILDSLVAEQVLANDGWKEVAQFADLFDVDKSAPRIEVSIYTADDAICPFACVQCEGLKTHLKRQAEKKRKRKRKNGENI